MQSVSSRIWTCVAVSISCDDNYYTAGILTIVGYLMPTQKKKKKERKKRKEERRKQTKTKENKRKQSNCATPSEKANNGK